MNLLARLGFILVGCFSVLDSLSAIGRSLNFASATDTPINPSIFFASLGFSVALGVLPGAFVILRSRWLADRSVPRTQATASPEAAELVSAAVAVLGIYLIVEGLASFLGFALMAGAFLGSSFTGFLADHVARSAGSALRALAGLFLFLYADRVGGFLRRRSHHGSTAGKGAA